MISVSAYPQCARKLKFQKTELHEPTMTKYWAAVCVASDIPDVQLTQFGGFNFDDMSDANGSKLLSRLEKFLIERAQRRAGNSVLASDGLRALLGARGIKTTMLKSEDDYWTAAETMFPGKITRNGGLTSLYVQIHSIPKKERQRLGTANLRNIREDWLSKATAHQSKIAAA